METLTDQKIPDDAGACNTKIIDPDQYRLRVLGLPKIHAGRYVEVSFTLFDECDEFEVGTFNEWFDIERPRKLMSFLEAIGQPYSETKKFEVRPSRWHNVECGATLLLKRWRDTQERNILLEFTPASEMEEDAPC